MSSERVLWQADDPEGAATQVNGRPIHALWSMLRPSFHRVFLEPHRPAGSTTVGWRWSGDAVPKPPALAHLTDLRQLMQHALLDLTADLERREGDADSVNPQELLAIVSTLVNGLVEGTDEDLSTYAVEVEDGWFIRSWGFSRPASARQVDGTEQADEPPSASTASTTADATAASTSPTTADATADASPLPPSAAAPSSVPPKSRARVSKRLGWVVAMVVLIGLGLVLFWAKSTKRLSFGRASTTPSETAPADAAKNVVGQDVEPHSTPPATHAGRSPDPAHGTGHSASDDGVAGGSSALSSTHGGESAARMASLSTAADHGESGSANAAVPNAIQGVMPSLAERPDDHAGPASDVAVTPESAPHVSATEGAAPPPPPTSIPSEGSSESVNPEHAESVPPSSTSAPVPTASASTVNSTLDQGQPVSPSPASSTPPQPPASTVTAEALPPPPESPSPLPLKPPVAPVDAPSEAPPPAPPLAAETPAPANPEPAPSVTSPDAPTPGDLPALETRPPWLREFLNTESASGAATASHPTPADATAADAHPPAAPPAPVSVGNLLVDLHAPVPTPTAGGAGATESTAKPAPEAIPPPPVVVIPSTKLSCHVGEFKVRLLRDAPLPTVPIERAGNDSLIEARAKAWAGTQALKPESFRTPLIQGGWSFRLAPSTAWTTPPKWLDVATGQPLVDVKVSADRLRLSWNGLMPTQDLSAHLVSDDGHEWARVVVVVDERRIEVTTGPEFIESVPWFAVELTPREAVPSGMVWRSRTPTWSDKRWETQLNRRLMSVRCLNQAARAQEATYGVVALVQPASGWALTWEVRIKPEDPLVTP